MIAYLFHPNTGEFIGEQECQRSPLEENVFLYPAYSTTKKPPVTAEHQCTVFMGNEWKTESDWRGTKAWNKKTAIEETISAIGIEPSDEVTLQDPKDIEYPIFSDTEGWIVDESKRYASAAASIRAQRSQLISAAQDRIDRHANELADGDIPTDTDVTVADVRKYIKILREITNQEGFPYAVNWPKEVS